MSEPDSDDSSGWTSRLKVFVLGLTAVQKLQWAFDEADTFITEHGDQIWDILVRVVEILLGLIGLALLWVGSDQK